MLGVHLLECPLDADLAGELQLASGANRRRPGLESYTVLVLEPQLDSVVDPAEGDALAGLVWLGRSNPGAHALVLHLGDGLAGARGPQPVLPDTQPGNQLD